MIAEKLPRSAPLVVVFASLLVCFVQKLYDFDLWFHLTLGREIVRLGALPETEFYVHAVGERAAQLHEWGFHVLVFLVHRAFGWWGLALLNAGLAALAVTLLAAAARRRGATLPAALGAAVAVAVLIAPRVQYRPELVLYAALAATLYVLERAEEDRRWLLSLPLLTVTLSLFHPSPILLVLAAGTRAIDLVLGAREDRLGAVVRSGAAILAAVVAVGLVPHGVDQLLVPFRVTGTEAGQTATITEYLPTLQTARAWEALALAAVVAVSLVVVRRRPSDVLLALGFGYIGFRHVRGLPLFALAVLPLVALGLERGLRLVPWRWARAAFPVAALGGLVVSAVSSPLWGAGPLEARFPAQAVRLIERYRPPGNILNQLQTGGFLAWSLYPPYRVAVDGHYWSVNEAHAFTERAFAAAPGWEEELRSRVVTLIATPASGVHGSVVPLAADMDGHPGWALAVAEPAGLLFVRADVAAAAGIPRLPSSAIWEAVLAETAQTLEWFGAGAPRAHLSRGIAYFRLRDYPRALAELDRYLALTPADAEATQIAGLLRATLAGDPRAAATVEAIHAARSR